MVEIVVGIAIGLTLSFVVFYFFRNRFAKQSEEMNETVQKTVEMKLQQLLPDVLKSANEQLITMADQKLGAEKKEIKTDIENKRSEIERLVKVIQSDLKESKSGLEKSEKERIGSFMALKSALDEYKKVTDQLSVTTEGLKKVLSNNQLRGQFGEQVADDLLKMSGFVRGVDYEFNKEQAGSETRPDFAIFLPDGTRINVDSKFPYNNLQKLTEVDDRESKDKYLKAFERDVKEKIKQVTTRDYINPEDKTVDFVILFIPNEMIFSFIYDKMSDLWKDAMEKKVILAGPFSFTAMLRLVKQSYENFRVQENVHKIIQHVKSFEKEFDKFYTEYKKIGDRIQSLEKQYNLVGSTRTNQLLKTVEKVKLEDVDSADNDEQVLLN